MQDPEPPQDPAAVAMCPDRAARLLAAMAGPTRLAMLGRLRRGEASPGELAEAVGLSASALSHQIARLDALGLIAARRRGGVILYRLASPEVEAVLDTLQALYGLRSPARCADRRHGRG